MRHIAGGVPVLEDLGSKNGTFVNGRRAAGTVRLSDRDEISIGSVRVRFRILSAQPSTETTVKDT